MTTFKSIILWNWLTINLLEGTLISSSLAQCYNSEIPNVDQANKTYNNPMAREHNIV